MTNKEKNIKLCKHLGWKVELDKQGFYRAVNPSGFADSDLWVSENNAWSAGMPDHFTDLNAMHNAEKSLVPANSLQKWWDYTDTLAEIVPAGWGNGASIHASADQRAEAIGKILNLW